MKMQVQEGGKEWLGTIVDSDVTFVQASKEGKGGKRGRRLKTRPLDMRDISLYDVDFLYKKVNYVFSRGRKSMGEAFLSQIGYVFAEWSTFPVLTKDEPTFIDQRTLHFAFSEASAALATSFMLEDIPLTELAIGKGSVGARDNRNKTNQVRAKLTKLSVELTHDFVCRGARKIY